MAGIDVSNGEWIRLVSSNNETENAVPLEDITYENGREVEIYDVVKVDILRPVPTNVQPENCLYNEDIKWKKMRESNLSEVVRLHGYDYPKFVFGNDEKSLNDENVSLTEGSLLLLQVESPVFFIKEFPDNKAVQLNFSYRGREYNYFKITQDDLKRYYENKPDGRYHSGSNVFVFSLTDRYYRNGKYYKVVAQQL